MENGLQMEAPHVQKKQPNSSHPIVHLFVDFAKGGKMNHTMQEAAQPFGITVSVTVRDDIDRLDSKVSSLWALFLHGIAVAVTDGQA